MPVKRQLRQTAILALAEWAGPTSARFYIITPGDARGSNAADHPARGPPSAIEAIAPLAEPTALQARITQDIRWTTKASSSAAQILQLAIPVAFVKLLAISLKTMALYADPPAVATCRCPAARHRGSLAFSSSALPKGT